MIKHQYTLHVDILIQVVNNGGKVKTGVDVYSKTGALLIDKNLVIDTDAALVAIKNSGVSTIPILPGNTGGIWDEKGNVLDILYQVEENDQDQNKPLTGEIASRVKKIFEEKKEVSEKYVKAKKKIKKVLKSIKASGGVFDYVAVEDTVTDLVDNITTEENPFYYLAKEIFSHDDYLYHHAINVCTIGTAVLKQYQASTDITSPVLSETTLSQIATGYFLHDIGKVLIPDHILNKVGNLSNKEFSIIKTHSYEKGRAILAKNGITTPEIQAIITFHHSAIHSDEPNCYPIVKSPASLPFYVIICKLADIYDAMTSKRCYKAANNPVGVVTKIVRKYAVKTPKLRPILHAFVKSIGICPSGSTVELQNQQLGYIIDSNGPLIIPFTDNKRRPLKVLPSPIDAGEETAKHAGLTVDTTKPLISPVDAYQLMPTGLKKMIESPVPML